MRQIIKNGTIVTGSGSFPADILIDGEKIAATGTAEEIKKLAQPGDKEIDASGCLIFPEFIDAHTHFDLHVAGTVTADDFATGTKAALKGGTTTIIDFGTQYPGETLVCVTVVVSLMLTIILAKTIGCTLPILAQLLHLDPAIMAAPLISTIVDACSLIVYFQIACHLLAI